MDKFRFGYLRIGTSIRTDRMIQIYDGEGNTLGHIDLPFAEWLLDVIGVPLVAEDRERVKLYESLDEAILDAKAHKRSIETADVYEKHITHH